MECPDLPKDAARLLRDAPSSRRKPSGFARVVGIVRRRRTRGWLGGGLAPVVVYVVDAQAVLGVV